MGNLLGIGVGNKPGIYYLEEPGITLISVYRRKIGGYKGSGPDYQVTILGVQGISTLRIVVKILITKKLGIHCNNRVFME